LSSVQFHAGFDPASSEPGYPVVESAPLNPLRRRLLRRTQRRAQELPELVGGSAWVFQTNERFALAPADGRMLSSDVVLNATMVAVVLLKKQLVPAVATLPTVHPDRRIAIRAGYSCQVIDPVRVLQEGCWDVRTDLVAYLLEDAKVQMLAARVDITDNPEVQQKLFARALARKALEPPEIPGMRVELVTISLDLFAAGDERGQLGHPATNGYTDAGADYGHDRYDAGGSTGNHAAPDQDDSYPPDGDGR